MKIVLVALMLAVSSPAFASFLQGRSDTLPHGAYWVTKFGRNPAVGSSLAFVSPVLIAPWSIFLSSAENIEVVSSSSSDADPPTIGCSEVTIVGSDDSFNEITEVVTMNGITAVPAVTNTSWRRAHRAFCSAAGGYTTGINYLSGYNQGDITITGVTSGLDLLAIAATRGQSEHAAWTVPAGHTAYLSSVDVSVDASNNNSASVYFWKRENADDTAGTVSAQRVFASFEGIAGQARREYGLAVAFPAKTDIWAEAIEAGTGTDPVVEVTFRLLVVPEGMAPPWR